MWWEVDLEEGVSIDRVVLWNVDGPSWSRLNNVSVSIGPPWHTCGIVDDLPQPWRHATVTCNMRVAQRVKIQHTVNRPKYLVLAEVQVFGTAGPTHAPVMPLRVGNADSVPHTAGLRLTFGDRASYCVADRGAMQPVAKDQLAVKKKRHGLGAIG